MKQKLKEEIEASQKGIDYVNSLVPTNNDVISIAKQQVNEMYEKYNIPLDEREIKSCSYSAKQKYLDRIKLKNRKL